MPIALNCRRAMSSLCAQITAWLVRSLLASQTRRCGGVDQPGSGDRRGHASEAAGGCPRRVLTNRGVGGHDVGRATERTGLIGPVQHVGGSVVVEQDTRLRILAAAKGALLNAGYAKLSTRGIAEAAGVPLSQIHYHFGSKQNLMLAVLDTENRLRLARQAAMYEADLPLWKQWLQACDFFDDDLESGYVRVLLEMTAAGWSDREIAAAVSVEVRGWFDLLAEVMQRAAQRFGSLSPFTPAELAALAGLPFIGAEALILLGLDDSQVAARSALRKVGELLRVLEEPAKPRRRR
jgi:AcrR family transcriptional regulator